MQRSNDNYLMPDMDRLVLKNPTKPKGVDITKLPIEVPTAPGSSLNFMSGSRYRRLQDPFMYRKKPVLRQNLSDFMTSVPSKEQNAVTVDPSLVAPAVFSFSSPMGGTFSTTAIDRFPNITNPTPYVGPSYRHRDILAANPNSLTHCRNKEAKEKCTACLLHDFKVCDARFKETNIKLADAKIHIETKTAKLSDNLKKKSTGWEGERNMMQTQMQDMMNEWDIERKQLVKDIKAEKDSKDGAIADAVKKSKESLATLIDDMERNLGEEVTHKDARINALKEELSRVRGDGDSSADYSMRVRGRKRHD